MSLQLSELLKESAFPNKPLDERDRKIIETAYKYGHEGIGFNRFVQELKPFASRSTVAFRVERLCALGYLERISNVKPSTAKPIRVSFRCFSILSMVEQVRKKEGELARRIREERSDQQLMDSDSFRKRYEELQVDWNGCFAMIGSIAILYGERAASDLFLPLMMESYTALTSALFSFIKSKPGGLQFMQRITNTRLASSGTSLQSIKQQVAEQMKKWDTVKKINSQSDPPATPAN